MQTLYSNYMRLFPVNFPFFAGRQIRYHTFDLANPARDWPQEIMDYLFPVELVCMAARALTGLATLTIDEKVVKAGMSQRRPKPHVDGCFQPDKQRWGGGGWLHYCNDVGASPIGRMAVIVASSVLGCRVWNGTFNGRPAADGDLSHISDQLGAGEVLPANMAYLLSPDCVHESMTFDVDTPRQFLRIALPVEYAESRVW